MGTAYQNDFYSWTREQARLLREGRLAELDIEHLSEEIEDMGKSEQRALGSFLETLLIHLLKWAYQIHYPYKRSWQLTILEQRKRILRQLKNNPGLKPTLSEAMADAYDLARLGAERETGIPSDVFPERCPWTFEQIADPDFWP